MPGVSGALRIAVVGVGKIGSAFAFQLAGRGGHDVTVVARPGSVRLAQLERDGAIVDVRGERVPVGVEAGLDAGVAYDLVIVTVLAHQMETLLPVLRRSAAGCIQFMVNMFDPERVEMLIGAERCAFGMPFVQALLDDEGRLALTIGAGGQKTIMSQARWAAVFTAAGVPAVVEAEMTLWLRCHAPLCVAFESIAVAGERRGGGARWREAWVLAAGVLACFELIEGLGYGVYPRSKRWIAASPRGVIAAVLWGMSRVRGFRVLLATGEAECCALVDAIVAVAARVRPGGVAAIAAMRPGVGPRMRWGAGSVGDAG